MACDQDVPCRGAREAAEQKDPDELTEDEQRLLDESSPDPCPTPLGMRAEGPLSPCDVEYCGKCHRLGHAGAIILALLLFLGLLTQTGLSTRATAGALGIFALVQHLTIGYLGYYPVLGPTLGVALKPVLPRTLQRDVRLSDYLPLMSRDTDESDSSIVSRITDALPDRSSSEDVVVDSDADTLKEKLREEKREKKKISKEKREKEQELEQIQQEKQQKDQQISEIKQEKKELEDRNQFYSHYRRTPAHANATPVDIRTGTGVKMQGYWVLDWFQMELSRPHCRGRFWFAIVITEEELRTGEWNEIPSLMEEDDARNRAYWDKVWPQPPAKDADDEVWAQFNPPKFLDASKNSIPTRTVERVNEEGDRTTHTVKEWDEADPQLFEERIDDVREAIADGQLAKLTLLYDEDGVYRGPDYDPRGFKTRSEWREKARGWKKRADELRSQISMMQDEMDDAQHELNLKQQELEEKERRLERLRDQLQDMSKTVRAQEFNSAQLEERYERASAELTEIESQLEAADEQRQRQRREKITRENDSTKQSAERNELVKNMQDKALALIQAQGWQGNGADVDIEDVRAGGAEMSRSEAIRAFLDDDNVDERDKDNVREVMDEMVAEVV